MHFYVPKQTDRSLIEALDNICKEIRQIRPLFIEVLPHEHGQWLRLPDQNPVQAKSIEYVLGEESQIMLRLYLKDQNGQVALDLARQPDKVTDLVTVGQDQNWINQLQDQRGPIIVKLTSLARRYLRAEDTIASFASGTDVEWNRYRDAQMAILNSLEQTQTTLVSDYSRRILETENASKARAAAREVGVRSPWLLSFFVFAQSHFECRIFDLVRSRSWRRIRLVRRTWLDRHAVRFTSLAHG